MYFPILNNFRVVGWYLSFLFKFKRNFCKQTVENLIRCLILGIWSGFAQLFADVPQKGCKAYIWVNHIICTPKPLSVLVLIFAQISSTLLRLMELSMKFDSTKLGQSIVYVTLSPDIVMCFCPWRMFFPQYRRWGQIVLFPVFMYNNQPLSDFMDLALWHYTYMCRKNFSNILIYDLDLWPTLENEKL